MNDELHHELFLTSFTLDRPEIQPPMSVGRMQVTGDLTVRFALPRRVLKRFMNRQRKFEQKMRKLGALWSGNAVRRT